MGDVESRSTFMARISASPGAKCRVESETAKASEWCRLRHRSFISIRFFFEGEMHRFGVAFAKLEPKDVVFPRFYLPLSTLCLLAARPATTLFNRARTHMETDMALPPPAAAAAAPPAPPAAATVLNPVAVSRCQCPRRVAALTPGLGTRRARKQALVPDTVPTPGLDCYLHVSATTLR